MADDLPLYASTQQYVALECVPGNADTLAGWGMNPDDPMNYHAGLWVVKQADTSLVVAIEDDASFQAQFVLADTL